MSERLYSTSRVVLLRSELFHLIAESQKVWYNYNCYVESSSRMTLCLSNHTSASLEAEQYYTHAF